jgi:polyisoprenoid-binding protein YceI
VSSAANDHGVDGRQNLAVGAYTIDPARTVISFKTRALWGMMGVRGTFKLDHGQITVADPVTDCTVEAVVSAASFESGMSARDDHVRSADYLDAARHPQVVFRGEHFEPAGDGGLLHGQLTVKEVTRPVTLEVATVTGDEHTLTARTTTTVDRFDFGITTARGRTGRRIDLTLDIVATR